MASRFFTKLARRRGMRYCRTMAEPLESRTLLAGNIVADVSDGNLSLTGDAENNLVDVKVVDGNIIVEGLDGTTINGSSDPFVAFEETTTIDGDFESSLAEGDDTLRLFGPLTIAGAVQVRDFDGITRLGMTDITSEQAVHITTGYVADEISIASSTFGSDLQVKAGRGDNLVSIFESTVSGKTLISAGTTFGHECWLSGWLEGRHDRLGSHRKGLESLLEWWRSSNPSHHRIWEWAGHEFPWESGSQGDNQVVIESNTLDDLHVSTGYGEDNVVVTDSTVSGKAGGKTGAGDDFVLVDETTFGSKALLRLGAGDDQLVSEGTNLFEDDAYANGGQGNEDAWQISEETQFDGQHKLRNFELTSVPAEEIETRGGGTLVNAADVRSILNLPGGIAAESEDEFVLV